MSRVQRALVRAIAIAGAVAVGAATVTVAPPAVHAQKVDKKKLAKQYVDAGLAAQGAGDFDSAIQFYEKAYAVVPHPVLLFNIGQAHRLAGRKAEALDFYQQYLVADPKGPESKDAKGFVATLEPQVAAEKAAAAEAAAAEQARLAEEARVAAEAEAARKKAEEDAKRQAEPEPEPDPEPEPVAPRASGGTGWKRITGIALGGVGLVGVGGGVFFGMKAKGISDDLSQPGAPYDPAVIARGEAAERNMFISYGVGGAMLIAGVVLFAIGGPKADAEEGVTLSPVVGGDITGFALTGGF